MLPDGGINATILNQCEISGADVYALVANLLPAVVSTGGNNYSDTIYGQGWLVGALQVATFNYLAQTATKIPQTDAGVNTLYTDGFPLVAQSNRLMYVFLNERPGELPTSYVIRGAGILMSPQDQADADIGTTHIAGFDAWQWLMGIPAFFDNIGTQIPQDGRLFAGGLELDGSDELHASNIDAFAGAARTRLAASAIPPRPEGRGFPRRIR